LIKTCRNSHIIFSVVKIPAGFISPYNGRILIAVKFGFNFALEYVNGKVEAN
jgi:hypothetical protein